MAQARGQGDERAVRNAQGQQSGSKRPMNASGAERPASKKTGIPPKGTARPGVSKKQRPEK
jgi:hypothetical protein